MSSVISTVVPVFGLIALGLLAGRFRYLSEAAMRGLPEFVFKVAMPIMLARTIGNAQWPDVSASAVIASFFGGAVAVWLLVAVATPVLLRRTQADAAALAMGAMFANSVMMGIPIALAHFGPEAAPLIALIILTDTPVLWLFATLHIAFAESGPKQSLGALMLTLARRLATNPIIVACLVGLAWQRIGVTLPKPVDTMVSMIAAAAIPGALVSMGLALNSYGLAGHWGATSLITGTKLLVMPAATYVLAAHVFGLSPLAVGVVTLLAAMPVGANAYLFATTYDRQVAAVSGGIAISTPLSALTLIGLLLALGGGAG